MKFSILAGLIAVICISQILPTSAHSDGGSLEKESGDYLIDVGYNGETFTTEETTFFNFALIDLKKQAPTSDYDSVRVIISKNKESYLATNIERSIIGPTVLGYKFSQAGPYTLQVSYEQGDVSIAEVLFDIEVSSPPSETDSAFSLGYFIIIFGAGLISGFVIQKLIQRLK